MIPKGSTIGVYIYVSTEDGLPATGKASSIVGSYFINTLGSMKTAIQGATFEEIDPDYAPGWYEFPFTFNEVGTIFMIFQCDGCIIAPWEEQVVEISASSAPSASDVATAVWCWTVDNTIPGNNSIYQKISSMPASVWGNPTRSLTTEVISVNKSLATDISASSIATAVWSDTTNYLSPSSKGYLQANGSGVWSQVAIHDSLTNTDTTYGDVLKSRASSSNVTSAKNNIIAAMPDIAGLSTFDPANDRVLIDSTQAASMVTATGFATPSDIPSDYAKPGDAMTLTSAYDAAKTASQLTSADIPTVSNIQSGLAKTSDLSGLSTFDPSMDTVTIEATQAATMTTATGFATSSDISGAVSALETYGDNHWTGGSSGGATAQQVWEYPGARTLTASPTDVSGLATKTDINAAQTAIVNAMPSTTGLATAQNVTDAKEAIIAEIPTVPNDYAKASDLSGLSTFNAARDKVTLNSTEDATLGAIKTKVDTLNNADLTGIATASDVSGAQSAIISAMPTIPNDYAKTTDVAAVNALIKRLDAGVLHWSTTATVLTLYNDDNTTLKTYTLQRDAQGNITRIDPNA